MWVVILYDKSFLDIEQLVKHWWNCCVIASSIDGLSECPSAPLKVRSYCSHTLTHNGLINNHKKYTIFACVIFKYEVTGTSSTAWHYRITSLGHITGSQTFSVNPYHVNWTNKTNICYQDIGLAGWNLCHHYREPYTLYLLSYHFSLGHRIFNT